MNKERLILWLVLVSVTMATGRAQQVNPPQQPAAGAQATDPKFRLIRSVSGTKALEEGSSYTIEDPRTVFYIPADKQVLVYLTWEGPQGPHHFEGLWKNPEGKVMTVSEFSFRSEKLRFGGYFSLLMTDTMTTGIWTLEARIDGESAGTHTFQIIAAPRPDSALPARRPLTRAELYQRTVAASVFIENLNDKGERQKLGAGFFFDRGRVLTAFEVIDGAASLRIIMPDGKRVETNEVIAWNRRQDWALLRLPSTESGLTPAAANSWVIGDRCFSIDVPAEGNRVLLETSVVGKRDLGEGGERLIIADPLNRRATGAPLLNEYGEVLGLIGGGLIPGTALLEDQTFRMTLPALGNNLRGALGVPMSLIAARPAGDSTTTLRALATAGQFIQPLVGLRNVISGTLSRDVNRKREVPEAIDEKTEFSRRETQGAVVLGWYPKEKRKGVLSLRIYDLNNRLVSENVAKKAISLSPNKSSYSIWQFGLTSLPTGIYRIDVLLDTDTVWRTFFRIVD